MKRLICSFSGGRTSAYMTLRVLTEWRERYDQINVIFANTGLEHEKTLEFVNNCDKHFGFNTVWVEAVIDQEVGVGTTHKIVTFETANRDGQPYYDQAKKHGLPNVARPHCTEGLKLNPVRSYVRDVLGHKRRDYHQCLGIRVDEMDRMLPEAKRRGIKYPLVSWGVTKQQILDWWAAQDFDLELPEHLGNCVTCFKKSDRKLFTIAKHNPEFFEPMQRMETDLSENNRAYFRTGVVGAFFRNKRTTADIIATSQHPFIEWTPTTEQMQMGLFSLDELDISNGCTESCEIDFI